VFKTEIKITPQQKRLFKQSGLISIFGEGHASRGKGDVLSGTALGLRVGKWGGGFQHLRKTASDVERRARKMIQGEGGS